MKKDLDWNSAIVGNEDWKAACNSEIFTNYVGIVLAKEQQEKAIKKAAQEKMKETEEFMKGMPNPLRSNFDYGKYEVPPDDEFGTARDAEGPDDNYLIGDSEGSDVFGLEMVGDADDSGAYTVADTGDGGSDGGDVADFQNFNKAVEADAMQLYDENIKNGRLNEAEKILGLDNNMYYQILKAEKGVE